MSVYVSKSQFTRACECVPSTSSGRRNWASLRGREAHPAGSSRPGAGLPPRVGGVNLPGSWALQESGRAAPPPSCPCPHFSFPICTSEASPGPGLGHTGGPGQRTKDSHPLPSQGQQRRAHRFPAPSAACRRCSGLLGALARALDEALVPFSHCRGTDTPDACLCPGPGTQGRPQGWPRTRTGV